MDTPKILIVDDQIRALHGMSRIMRGAGYWVLEADNGLDCLKLAAEHKPDLILLDVVLPDIDGREVCNRIKSDPETSDIYVVLFSSVHIDPDSQAEGLEQGADGYISRPIPNRELLARVKSILRLKDTENRLRASEARYRIVADFTYDWEYWVDTEGNFLYVSPSCERITGYSAEEFIADPDLMNRIIHPDDRSEMLGHFHNVRKAAPLTVGTIDFRIICRDGHIVWLNHACQPVYGKDAQPLTRRACNRDVTERKRAEDSIKHANSFLDTLLEAIPLPIFYKDTNGLFTGFNKAFEEFYGKTREELVGKSVFDVYPEDLAKVYYAKDNELFHNPGIQVYETPIQDGLGVVHDIIFHKSTYFGSRGQVKGLIGVILDITKRKRLEKEKESLIIELQQALSEVKKLSGFLPICASCKKIRDDQGYWNEVERYIGEHSEVEFSHGICPDCMRALYPEIADDVLVDLEKDGNK